MSRLTFLAAIIGMLSACATTAPRQVVNMTTILDVEIPSLIQGEPVRNAELASYLAEFELARRGIDCRANRMTVSYCEGVYTVAFHTADQHNPVEKYTVDISANDSTILRLTRTKRAG